MLFISTDFLALYLILIRRRARIFSLLSSLLLGSSLHNKARVRFWPDFVAPIA